jgi:hypothetical protein
MRHRFDLAASEEILAEWSQSESDRRP